MKLKAIILGLAALFSVSAVALPAQTAFAAEDEEEIIIVEDADEDAEEAEAVEAEAIEAEDEAADAEVADSEDEEEIIVEEAEEN